MMSEIEVEPPFLGGVLEDLPNCYFALRVVHDQPTAITDYVVSESQTSANRTVCKLQNCGD
jgi:hypothetical protein